MSFTVTNGSKTQLTDEQKERMEQNRLKALKIKQTYLNQYITTTTTTKTTSTSSSSSTNTTTSGDKTSTFASSNTASKATTGEAPAATAISSSSTASSNMLQGKCIYLGSDSKGESRFEVQVGYNKTLIDIFKSIKR